MLEGIGWTVLAGFPGIPGGGGWGGGGGGGCWSWDPSYLKGWVDGGNGVEGLSQNFIAQRIPSIFNQCEP